jgi:trehalose-6-phosphate hydrolase
MIGKDEVIKDGDKYQYTDKEIVHDYLKEMRKNTYGDREDILTVGEMSSTRIEHSVRYASPKKEELDTVFQFHHLKADHSASSKWSTGFFNFNILKSTLHTWLQH